jgi:hypothetical protein
MDKFVICGLLKVNRLISFRDAKIGVGDFFFGGLQIFIVIFSKGAANNV